jgi:hypothetical protein
MVYQHMTRLMDFPVWAAITTAICVETLGLSAVQTTVTFWQYNSTAKARDPRAPIGLALLTGLFYLTTVLTVNAMLDQTEPIYRIAKALLSSLSVSAGVILALRAGHTRRLAQVAAIREQLRAERAATRAARHPEQPRPPFPVPLPSSDNGRHKQESIR